MTENINFLLEIAMREGYYGKEPFDLRLTALRMLRNLNQIIVFTLAGTLVFGGGYYLELQ